MRKSKMMKALLVFGMSVVTATAMVGFAACDTTGGGGDDGHKHAFNGNYNGYMADANQHWHLCKDCEEELDLANHVNNDGDNKCDVCGWELEHSFDTSEWKSDASGHWYAPTCSHTTEKGSFAAHKDDDGDGVCDVCDYKDPNVSKVFTDLLAKTTGTGATATRVLAESFFVSSEVPESIASGQAGLYSAKSTTCYTEVRNGAAYLVDTDNSASTTLYASFGNTYGTIEGYFEITPDDTPNITPIQFYGVGGTSEIFGLRMQGGSLNYRLEGKGNGEAVNPATTVSANTAIKVYFNFNSATKEMKIKLGDNIDLASETYAATATLSNNLGGIKFVSQGSGTKSFSVDNIVVINTGLPASTVAEEATKSVNSLDTAANGLKGTAWTAQDTQTKLDNAKSTALADIATAETANNIENINAAVTAHSTAVYGALQAEYTARILAAYPTEDYNADNNWDKDAYTEAITAFNTAIASANTIDKLNAAYTAADNALKVLKNDNNEYWTKQDAVITIGDKTLKVKVGDTVTKDQLDALVNIPSGQGVSGYKDGETTISLPYTATGNVTLTPVLVDLTLTDVSFLCVDMTVETLTANKVIAEGITIMADAEHDVSIDANDKTIALGKATHRIKLNGTGSANYRSIKLELKAGATITVYALSGSSSAERTLTLYDADYKTTGQSYKFDGNTPVKELTYTVSSAGTYYIASEASSINIHGIKIEYTK